MFPFYQLIQKLVRVQVSSLGLSLFRIFFSIILLLEVGKLFYFRHLYFDPIPYLVKAELSFSLIFIGWLGVIFFGLLIGFQTRIAAVINYILVLVFFSCLTTLKYHFDSALIGISFLLLFLPINKSLSLDSFFYKKAKLNRGNLKVSLIFYYLPVIQILGLQYFDSFFHKAASEFWIKGLGIWLPASLPNQVYNNFSWLLNQRVIITSLGYLVLLFEVTFLAFLFVKKLRPFLIITGICFHLGIALIFPIPTFGITYVGIYLLLLPLSYWKSLENWKVKLVNKTYNLFFASGRMVELRLTRWVKSINLYTVFYKNQEQKYSYLQKSLMTYFFIIYISFGQLIETLNSPLIESFSKQSGLTTIRSHLAYVLLPFAVINKKILGITENIIYTGFFEGTYDVLGIEYIPEKGDKIWVPINEYNGMANPKHFGRMSAVTASVINPDALTKLKKITAFWAYKNNISLQGVRFTIFKKPVSIQYAWERDYLNKQLKKPWKPVGQLVWRNNQATFLY